MPDSGGIPDTIGEVVCADNLDLMVRLSDACCDLIYGDPPFFTGKTHTQADGKHRLNDCWQGDLGSYLDFLRPRLQHMRRLLKPTGSLYLHLDWHAVHYAKVMLDEIFGYDHFCNEIVWSYRTGGRSRRHFARKHDTILAYARCAEQQRFHLQHDGEFRTDGMKHDERGRPYKQTKAGRLYFNPEGPAMTDVWEIPFLSTVSLERTGYPTQKPETLLERIVNAATDPGDVVADFFCGSGTTLAVAHRLGRRWLGCDINPEAADLARQRLAGSQAQSLLPFAEPTG
jgi:site-specific DNA-methyltransferase (adenine-specific)